MDRLIASPRIERGVRAFFADMLGFSDFETVSKDPTFFPRYTPSVKDRGSGADAAHDRRSHRESARRLSRPVHHAPYLPDRLLAALYDVPLSIDATMVSRSAGCPIPIRRGDPRAGLLSEASFTTLYSPSGRTSPTVRGKALRENILCEKVPAASGQCVFKFVEDTTNPQFKTARDAADGAPDRTDVRRLPQADRSDRAGAGELRFRGRYRTTENGVPIDAQRRAQRQAVRRLRRGSRRRCTTIRRPPAVWRSKAFAFETGYLPPKDDPQWQQISRSLRPATTICSSCCGRLR